MQASKANETNAVSEANGTNGANKAEAEQIAVLERPLTVRRRGVEARLVLTNQTNPSQAPDPALVDLVTRANIYLASLTDGSGKSLSQIADDQGIELSEVSRLLPLAFLSPAITDAILTGKQPIDLGARRLSRMADLPHSWAGQSALLNL